MKGKTLSLLCLLLAIASLPLHAADIDPERYQGCYRGARKPAHPINFENVAISTQSGTSLQPEQVKRGILQALLEKNWTVSQQPDGKLLGVLEVRKHAVSVEIAYASDKYSIKYLGSRNMNYSVCNGDAFIHPNYNAWVSELNRAIKVKFMQL